MWWFLGWRNLAASIQSNHAAFFIYLFIFFVDVLQMVSAVRSARCTNRAHNHSHCCAHRCGVVRQQVKTKSINVFKSVFNMNQEEIPLKILPISHIHHGALSLSVLSLSAWQSTQLILFHTNVLPPPLCQEKTVRQSFHNRAWAFTLALPNPFFLLCHQLLSHPTFLDSHIIIPTQSHCQSHQYRQWKYGVCLMN